MCSSRHFSALTPQSPAYKSEPITTHLTRGMLGVLQLEKRLISQHYFTGMPFYRSQNNAEIV